VWIFFCSGTDISVTVSLIGMKFCMMIDKGHGQVFSPFGGSTPKGSLVIQNFGPLKSRYLENSKSQHYMPIRA